MKVPNLSKWVLQPELEGMLVFAQALEEMLFHHTVDSFKASALNLHTSVLESRFLASQLVASRIRAGTLTPALKELETKLKCDPVIDLKENPAFGVYLERITASKDNPRELFVVCDALADELHFFYWEKLRNKIIEAVALPKNKTEILALATSFVGEAELQGFSRSFIYYRTQRFFFTQNTQPEQVMSVDQISDFLSIFYQEPSGWTVVFRGSAAFKDMIDYAENFHLQITTECPGGLPSGFRNDRFLGKSTEYPIYVVAEDLKMGDPISARDQANARIEMLSAVYSFLCHEEKLNVGDITLVVNRGTNESSLLKLPPNPMKHGARRPKVFDADDLVRLIEILRGNHFDQRYTLSFIKSIDYHRAALEAKTPENQLLDLWASLEGFLPPPSEDENRIKHYVDALVPSLTLTYSEKILQYIADSMYYGGSDVRKLIEGLQIDGDFFVKSVAIVVAEDLEKERAALFARLDHHPLLRFRIFQTNEQFKSTKHIRHTILEHKQRVSWHIQRIYTTRNQIIHSAQSLPYLTTLVENLHSYVDILLKTLSTVGIASAVRLTIPSALMQLSVHEQNYIHSLEGDDKICTCDNFKCLIFGKDNPVSPFNLSISP